MAVKVMHGVTDKRQIVQEAAISMAMSHPAVVSHLAKSCIHPIFTV